MRKTIIVAAAIVTTLLMLIAGSYTYGRHTAAVELAELKGKISQQKLQAKNELEALIKERDKKQATLDAQARQQEETDNAAKNEIARLTNELASRPVRVRVITASGACSGSAAGNSTSSAEAGAGNTNSTSGLLPESNSRRLRAAIAEVETLSAAYSSCRKRLFSQ